MQSQVTTHELTVAAGCFWGVEHLYRQYFGAGRGLLNAKVGYCGGNTANPSYSAVCSGDTGRKLSFTILPHSLGADN